VISCVLPTPFHLQWLRDISCKKSAEMTRLYSQVCWLGQHNAGLVLHNIDANTKMTDLGARQQALEEELARTAGERDVQRAAAEQKAREAEAQAAELQHLRTALEEKAREAEAQSNELRRLRTPLSRSPGPSGKRARPSRRRRWPFGMWGPPLRRRKTPCPRSKRPPESDGGGAEEYHG